MFNILLIILNIVLIAAVIVLLSRAQQGKGKIDSALEGIELVEWFDHEDGRHKKRKLNRTPENIKKAETYLARLRGNADEQR